MNINNSQNSFSKLFIANNVADDFSYNSISPTEHPFIFISNYLNYKKIKLNTFKQGLLIQEQLKLDINHSYNCFELELNILEENKLEYLNTIIDFLFEQLNSLKRIHNQEFQYRLMSNLIMTILTRICTSHYHIHLSSKNRKKLSKWFHLKEPITSFILKKLPEDKWFENRGMNKMIYGFENKFISKNTSFSTFKALFEGKTLENKINWIDNKASLYYFIKLLISSKIIINPKNKHWAITSEFFLLNGESLKQKDLLNQKATTNLDKKHIINEFINRLENYNS